MFTWPLGSALEGMFKLTMPGVDVGVVVAVDVNITSHAVVAVIVPLQPDPTVKVYPAGPTTSTEYASFALSVKGSVPLPTFVEVESAFVVESFKRMPVVSEPCKPLTVMFKRSVVEVGVDVAEENVSVIVHVALAPAAMAL